MHVTGEEHIANYESAGQLDYAHAVISETLRSVNISACSQSLILTTFAACIRPCRVMASSRASRTRYRMAPKCPLAFPWSIIHVNRTGHCCDNHAFAPNSPLPVIGLFGTDVLGRLPTLWPDRPEEFVPERWQSAKPTPFEWPVFNAGPRLCLGKQVAYLESKIVMYARARLVLLA